MAHCCAMDICSAVRVSEIARTSASALLNAGDRNAGGAGGRNSSPELIKYGFTAPSSGPDGGPLGIQSPGPVGIVPVHTALKPSFVAHAIITSPITRPSAT